jgi:hypothetical protein
MKKNKLLLLARKINTQGQKIAIEEKKMFKLKISLRKEILRHINNVENKSTKELLELQKVLEELIQLIKYDNSVIFPITKEIKIIVFKLGAEIAYREFYEKISEKN